MGEGSGRSLDGVTDEQILELLAGGLTVPEVAATVGMSIRGVYNRMQRYPPTSKMYRRLPRQPRPRTINRTKAIAARRQAADERFPPALRQQVIDALETGELLRDVLQVVPVTSTTLWERTRWDPVWAAQLALVLEEHRPAGWSHGHAATYDRGCRCTECRDWQRAARSGTAETRSRTRFDVDRMIELYESGLTLDQVGEQMGVLGATVSKRLRAAGVDRRRAGPAGSPVADERILELRAQGLTVAGVGRAVGMSKDGVYTRLRKIRLKQERPRE